MLLAAMLISTGLALLGGLAGNILAVVGLLAIGEAMFDVLLVGPLLGSPIDGRAIRRRL